jgi:predicted phosphoribosyltransferase
MADEINSRFNEGFDKSQRENAQSNEFWENVRSMEVRGDKLIITTNGVATGTTASR